MRVSSMIGIGEESCELWRFERLWIYASGRVAVACLLLALCMPARADFDAEFRAYSGDLDGNGYNDLFLSRSPNLAMILLDDYIIPVPTRAAEHVVLLQAPNGTFTVNASPTSAELSIMRSWSQSPVQLTAVDINVDGQQDLFIKNFGADPKFSAATPDRIVYAKKGSSAAKAVAVSQEMRDFFRQTYGWRADRDYFIRTAADNGWYHYLGDEVEGWFYIDYIDFYYAYAGGAKQYLDESDDPADPNNVPAYCLDYPLLCRYEWSVNSWLVYGVYLNNIEIVIEYDRFNQDALSFAQAVGAAFDLPVPQSYPTQAEAILEAKMMTQSGDTVADVLRYPAPRPAVPPDMTPEPPLRRPRGPLGPAANNPNVYPKAKTKIHILGRILVTVCDLICGSDERERLLDWRDFGFEWALDDMEKRNNWTPNVVIGEGEGGGIYRRIPLAAQAWNAIYLTYGVDPSTGAEAPFSDAPPETWPDVYYRYMWEMNHGWLHALMAAPAMFYDVQLHGPRARRGFFYPCERKVLETYPLREERPWLEWAPYDNTPCSFM